MRVGIDLGTTYCAIACIDPKSGKAKIIENLEGSPITPSVLYFSPDGKILHGEEAKAFLEEEPELTANYFKYHMGDDTYRILRNGKEYTAVDLSAELLRCIVRDAEIAVNEDICDAVITVPAYFDHFKRQATMEAGKKAGLNVLNIISEPTAAVFAYGIHGKGTDQTILVYDLGGGTFDVTIAHITDDEIKILGTDGDHRLGGKDWDDALAEYLSDQFEEEFDIDISSDPEMAAALQAQAEDIKKKLTSKQKHAAMVNYGGKRGTYTITRELFDDITAFNLNKTKDIINRLLAELSMEWADIEGTLLVGGSTRMQQVHDYVRQMCGKPPMGGVNVDEAVALGAAIRANIDADGKAQVQFTIGGKSTSGPAFAIAGARRIKDATAHSMGMIAVSKDGSKFVNSIMIPKNSEIPAKITQAYELGISKKQENKQEVYVLQGEEEEITYPLNCTVLGKYVFTGIQAGNERKEQIDVTFCYDENNIVQVSAVQKRTGADLKLHIEPVEEDMGWVTGSPKERLGQMQTGISVMLAVDLSGSMDGERLKEAKKAAVSFIREFDMDNVEVGLINFADRCIVYQGLTHDAGLLERKINSWAINADGLGYGNAAEPFLNAMHVLRPCGSDVRYLVVLTDGYWSNVGNAVARAKQCHGEGIEVIALGFGNANQRFLEQVASKADFASLTDLSHLESALTGIAKIM